MCRTNFIFAFLFFISSNFNLFGQANSTSLDKYLELVRAEYDGKEAYETTAYVAQFWRQAGNPGFDSSIYRVKQLLEQAGYQEAKEGSPLPRLSYRLERYPLRTPAWAPIKARLAVKGEESILLDFASNRNMVSINSFSTPPEGIEAELVYLQSCDAKAIKDLDLKGKIVMADCHSYSLYKLAVEKKGAIGVLAYRVPDFNQPDKHPNSIPFRSIPFNNKHKAWAINLSLNAKEILLKKLEAGTVKLQVNIETQFYEADELALIAEIQGDQKVQERFVFSAHVQEPGANDNASGVGAQTEMARTAAALVQAGKISPNRTITFLWGDEIRATRRYIQQDEARAKHIRWGMSLDMVGEDTEKTGGTFLIEKMPDPSAVWTRGADKHTEWGASPVSLEDFNPHYFNDLVEYVCRQQASATKWVVNTNPFEGGSDHQPFLDADIPGLLLWHFTDVFYHTDADRIDKVSAQTLSNVGVSALCTALQLCTADETTVQSIIAITEKAALKRLATEGKLSRANLSADGKLSEEKAIIEAWHDWYTKAITKVTDVLIKPPSKVLLKQIENAVKNIESASQKELERLK